MLMIRPQRFLVMPLRTALVIRNTELRFVLMTSSHCASFIRIISVSFVMPALFTRMSTPPNSSSTALMTAATLSGSTTSSFMPLPFKSPPKRSLMASAPPSEVAVPMTVAPAEANFSAIAAPIPREAPVTKATLPVKSKPPAVAARAISAPASRCPTPRGWEPLAKEAAPLPCATSAEAEVAIAAPRRKEAKVKPPPHAAAMPTANSKVCLALRAMAAAAAAVAARCPWGAEGPAKAAGCGATTAT
mmetsp:Transcript_63358/g.159788  ORF Transcript_63358/g.159788 Transcript_63358/m.159788 type:complete len:246 (+) Transcript_63358:466-1203(+)